MIAQPPVVNQIIYKALRSIFILKSALGYEKMGNSSLISIITGQLKSCYNMTNTECMMPRRQICCLFCFLLKNKADFVASSCLILAKLVSSRCFGAQLLLAPTITSQLIIDVILDTWTHLCNFLSIMSFPRIFYLFKKSSSTFSPEIP